MKVYKDGMEINATKDQLPALKASGWTRIPPKKEDDPVVEETTSDERPKKIIRKKKIKKD